MINKLFLSLYSLIFCLCISAEAVSQVNIQAQRLNSIGSGYRERSFRVENDQSGSTYVIGLTRGTPDYDFNGGGFIPENYNTPGYFLIKYNQLHQPLWGYQTKYPESLLGILNSKISRNGNLIIAGYYSGLFIDIDFSSASVSHLVNQPYGNYGLYVAVYDSAGHFLYHNEIIAQHDSLNVMLGDRTFISDIETDDDDNIYVTGYSGDVMLPAGNQNDTLKEFTYFMAKYDSACNLIWLHHLNKEIKEFHNWTNFNNLMLDADHAGNLYATITFTDSLNICFENEGPQYVFAKPYDYQWNPFSAESHNRDFIIIKYDNNGHYLKHVQFGSAINSTQKHLDAIFANDKLTVLAAFDSEINFSDTAFHSSGQDTVYDYNLALMQFDTALQCVTKHRFYNNILSPRQGNNYLAADECGNVLLRCNLSEIGRAHV